MMMIRTRILKQSYNERKWPVTHAVDVVKLSKSDLLSICTIHGFETKMLEALENYILLVAVYS